MNKKLIAVDLDGTLLNSESKLSPFTIKTIQKVTGSLLQLGVPIEWQITSIRNWDWKVP